MVQMVKVAVRTMTQARVVPPLTPMRSSSDNSIKRAGLEGTTESSTGVNAERYVSSFHAPAFRNVNRN